MDYLINIARFLADNIFGDPAYLIGIVAMVGLILQKKSFSDVVQGTLKTAIGFMILINGAMVLVGAIGAIAPMLETLFGIEAAVALDVSINDFMATYGGTAALVMTFGFLLNCVLARITKMKYIYLTGHQMFFLVLLILAVMIEIRPDVSELTLVVIGSIVAGIYWTVQPAYIQPLMRKVMGNDEVAFGHTSSFSCFVSGVLGKFVGKPEQSTEEIKLPKWLNFITDITAGVGFLIALVVLVLALIIGPQGIGEAAGGTNYLFYAVRQGLTFGMGITVLLFGVRMVIAEIVPAFRGIAMKIVPDAKPALDVPVTFQMAPTAVIVGFVSCTITFLLSLTLFGALGLGIIIPWFVILFFVGGGGGVFGNATGGLKGAILGGVLTGIILAVGQLITAPYLSNTAPELAFMSDPDFYVLHWILKPILTPILGFLP